MAESVLLRVERESQNNSYNEIPIPEREYDETYGIAEELESSQIRYSQYFLERKPKHPEGDIKTVTKGEQEAYKRSIAKNLEILSRTPHSLYSQILLKMQSGRNADKIVRGLAQKVGIDTEDGLYQLDRVLKSFADIESLSLYGPLTDAYGGKGIVHAKPWEMRITAKQIRDVAEILGREKCSSFNFAQTYKDAEGFYDKKYQELKSAGISSRVYQGINRRTSTSKSRDLKHKVEEIIPVKIQDETCKAPVRAETQQGPAKPARRGWFGKLKGYTSQVASYLFFT